MPRGWCRQSQCSANVEEQPKAAQEGPATERTSCATMIFTMKTFWPSGSMWRRATPLPDRSRFSHFYWSEELYASPMPTNQYEKYGGSARIPGAIDGRLG